MIMNDQSRQPGSATESDLSEKLNVFPCFMPDQPCVDKIVKWINLAQESILVQAYSFSSSRIAQALINARQKRVKVKIMIDKNAEKKPYSLIQILRDRDIDIQVDQQAGKAHNKVMIIDNERVITGSYNWTDELFYNDSDVIVFIKDTCVNQQFKYNWDALNSSNRKLTAPFNLFAYTGLFDCGNCTVPLSNNSPSYTDKDEFAEIFTRSKKMKQESDYFVEVHVCFPRFNNQDCIKLISSYINKAKKSIFIQACSLTHKEILNALIYAGTKYIDVKLLVDKKVFDDISQQVSTLINSGFKVRCDTSCHRGIAHSKTIIIDDDLVLTGSLNLTNSAQNFNQENLLYMKNIYVNSMFKEKFDTKWNASKPIDQQDKQFWLWPWN